MAFLLFLVFVMFPLIYSLGHDAGNRLGSRKGYGVGYDRGRRASRSSSSGCLVVFLLLGSATTALAMWIAR